MRAPPACREHTGMQPLYLARIEDLGQGDFVKVDCAACHNVALLTPEFLLKLGLSPQVKVLDLKTRVRCRGCGAKGRAVVSIKWRREIG
jgi:ribosomal protein S27E